MGLQDRLERKDSETLKKIYRENDRTEWPKEGIEMAGKILEERGEELPEQETPTEYKTSSGKLNEEDLVVSKDVFPRLILGGLVYLPSLLGLRFFTPLSQRDTVCFKKAYYCLH